MPRVSVILACYDRLPFLRYAVESVRAQTLTDWELIIADDGSGEAVQSYLRELQRDARIRVLGLPHSGNPAAVRNTALREATGEYIAFIDSDDVWLPRKLELQVASLQKHGQCAWGYTAYDYIDARGNKADLPQLAAWSPHEGQALAAAVGLRLMSALPSVIAERSLLEEVGGFDEKQSFYEDHDLWFRLALRSNADVVPAVLLRIRKHDEHYSSTDRIRAAECKALLLRRMFATVGEPSLRRTIRRLRAGCAANLADLHLTAPGGRSRALQALIQAAPYAWPYSSWWAGLLRALAATIVPRHHMVSGLRPKRTEL